MKEPVRPNRKPDFTIHTHLDFWWEEQVMFVIDGYLLNLDKWMYYCDDRWVTFQTLSWWDEDGHKIKRAYTDWLIEKELLK